MKWTKTQHTNALMWMKKKKAIDILGGCCKICGKSDLRVLQFHHKEAGEKEIEICLLKNRRWSEIEKEIKKCVLLCSNCHRELHWKENAEDRRRSKLRLCLLRYMGSEKCSRCGYHGSNPNSLDIHHKHSKKYDINLKLGKRKAITESILDETEKCEVICSNCHMIEHTKMNKEDMELIEIKNREHIEKPKLDWGKIEEMLTSGSSLTEISLALGCSKGSVHYVKQKINMALAQSGRAQLWGS